MHSPPPHASFRRPPAPTNGRQVRILSPIVGVRATKKAVRVQATQRRSRGCGCFFRVPHEEQPHPARCSRETMRGSLEVSRNLLAKLGFHGVDIRAGDPAAAGTTATRTGGRFVRLADIGPSIERAAGDEQAESPEPVPIHFAEPTILAGAVSATLGSCAPAAGAPLTAAAM
jgi:hypothetical protein